MIKVKLLRLTERPEELMSYAALSCYQAEEPIEGKKIDLENRIFKTGHHTILQHIYATFFIEGAAVSDFTFGLHLASPFYNTSQRSGRFCSDMFIRKDIGFIEEHIRRYWPHLRNDDFIDVMQFIKSGLDIFKTNIDRATEIAAQEIKKERPHATEKYIHDNARKFAQEQLRVFVPTIFPTAATMTLDSEIESSEEPSEIEFNISAITALYRTAWSPTLVDIMKKMVSLIKIQYPNLAFMFKDVAEADRNFWEWIPDFDFSSTEILTKPRVKNIHIDYKDEYHRHVEDWMLHPTDLSNFHPRFMNNREIRIATEVEISVATMGQDQRHRTIARTEPKITGNFYLPPLAIECGLEHEAIKFMNRYKELAKKLREQNSVKTLATSIIPYGATVTYRKISDLNAMTHEMLKRCCWCAQEEIYHLAVATRNNIERAYRGYEAGKKLLAVFPPICLRTGKCGEGSRYCGRIIGQEPHFPERKI